MFGKISPKRKFNKNRQWLYNKYIIENKSLRDISEIPNIHRSTVCYWIHRFGIKSRKLHDDHPNKHKFREKIICGREVQKHLMDINT